MRSWRHVIKLDPDRNLCREDLKRLISSGTDAILVGGTQGITAQKVQALMERIREEDVKVPVWQEISSVESISLLADGFFIPLVLNSNSTDWLVGHHVKALEWIMTNLQSILSDKELWLNLWDRVIAVGYVSLNPDAAVSRLTEARSDLSPVQAAAYGMVADRVFKLPAVYIEYSGVYGSPRTVQVVREAVNQAHIFYGGGIQTGEQAVEMARWADTIVIGNAIYEIGPEVVERTVEAVKGKL